MLKTVCSTALIFSAMSMPISSAGNIVTANPYVMEQTEGNEVYRPLFYVESKDNVEENFLDKKLEYSNLIFTENSEYHDIFINNDRSFIVELWSDYWTKIEKIHDAVQSPLSSKTNE